MSKIEINLCMITRMVKRVYVEVPDDFEPNDIKFLSLVYDEDDLKGWEHDSQWRHEGAHAVNKTINNNIKAQLKLSPDGKSIIKIAPLSDNNWSECDISCNWFCWTFDDYSLSCSRYGSGTNLFYKNTSIAKTIIEINDDDTMISEAMQWADLIIEKRKGKNE